MSTLVEQMVGNELRQLGFKSESSSWHRDVGEIIHVAGLQKSKWSSDYYINLAVWIKSIAKDNAPDPSQCPLQCRIDAIPDNPEELVNALTEEDSWRMDPDHRNEVIKYALCNADFMFFSKLKTLADVIGFLKASKWEQLAVDRELARLVSEKGD